MSRFVFISLCLLLAATPLSAEPRVFVDDLGDTLRWDRAPERIVSLSPSITETLFAIGIGGGDEGQRLVGVTRFCDEPPAARSIPSVGGIVDPSLESIRSVEPDLVITTRGNLKPFFEALRDLGIPMYAVETDGGLRPLLEGMRRLGHALGRPEASDALVDGLEARLDRLERATGSIPADERPRVYYGSLEPPLWTAGPGSMIDDVIRAAGGVNVASDAPTAWAIYSLERIVAADPQVYLGTFAPGGYEEDRKRALRLLSGGTGWKDTQAGRTGRLCLIDENLLLRPGPRIISAAEDVARCLVPEREGAGR